jgi:hypothetical protein
MKKAHWATARGNEYIWHEGIKAQAQKYRRKNGDEFCRECAYQKENCGYTEDNCPYRKASQEEYIKKYGGFEI